MAETTTKNSRLRSPAYPYLDLQESVDKLELFYKAESLHHTPVNVAATDIGYKDGSNRGWRALASLTSFGLLDEEGSKENRHVFLSDLGKEIIHFGDKESADAKKAIREAALKPTIYTDLWTLWLKDGQSLPSEEAMKRYLIKEKAFNPQSVDDFIKGFKNTLNYAGLIKDGKITSSDGASGTRDQNNTPLRQRNTGERMNNPNLQDNTIPLIGGSTAILTIPRPLSKKNFDLIKSWLTLMEPSLTEDNNTVTKKEEDENEE
jgi:hypothetical protein